MINKENFKKALKFLKKNKKHIQANLAMDTFGDWVPDKSGNVCNSPACIVGHIISGQTVEELGKFFHFNPEDGTPKSVSYWEWSFDYFFTGESPEGTRTYNNTDIWHFLFFDNWPNDIGQAIKRMEYVLQNEDVPDDWFIDKIDYQNSDYEYTL